MAKETKFERNVCGARLKRADDLKLGDRVITLNALDEVQAITVFSLALLGDDVEVNGRINTSIGNTFFVID